MEISNHKTLTAAIAGRPQGTPLITVSNHCSSLDDPLLFSALIPWPIRQWQLRWSLCNDDMFFIRGEVSGGDRVNGSYRYCCLVCPGVGRSDMLIIGSGLSGCERLISRAWVGIGGWVDG